MNQRGQPTAADKCTCTFDYYLLVPPTVIQVQDGAILWSTSGQTGLPREFLTGDGGDVYDIYDAAGTKLNGTPIGLTDGLNEQNFLDNRIKAGDTITVVVKDKYGNAWPELPAPVTPPAGTATLGALQFVHDPINIAGTYVDLKTFTIKSTGSDGVINIAQRDSDGSKARLLKITWNQPPGGSYVVLADNQVFWNLNLTFAFSTTSTTGRRICRLSQVIIEGLSSVILHMATITI